MMGIASRVVGPLLVALFLVGCGTQQSSQRAATISTADVGTCRGAFQDEAEAMATEWIPLAQHLLTPLDAVCTAQRSKISVSATSTRERTGKASTYRSSAASQESRR